jgi:hypothetical protein
MDWKTPTGTAASVSRFAVPGAFRTCDIQTEGIGIEVPLKKRGAA